MLRPAVKRPVTSFRALLVVLAANAMFLGSPGRSQGSVVISEIHYNPRAPHGKTLEFIELHNVSDSGVPLTDWHFAKGIEYIFPEGAVLPAGGFVVVCRDREAFIEQFGESENLFGDYRGALDNDGEEVIVADGLNAVIDAVRYDDSSPWPAFADGEGASLQRVCSQAPSHQYENWVGAPIDRPTPLEPSSRAGCPLPPLPSPRITFSEIYYHPPENRDDQEEYIELYNPGEDEVEIGNWRFSSGITFTFPEDTVIGPRDYLVVCRNQEFIREAFETEKTVGNFTGILSNSGERLNLVDETGALVDTVSYRDDYEWHYGADGAGRSLEKIVLEGRSDDPANWTQSVLPRRDFRRIEGVGTVDGFRPRLILGINGAGEFIIDDVVLERLDQPGVNLIPDGDFEEGLGGWRARGNAAESRVEDGIGGGGSRGLRLLSAGNCTSCGSTNSVTFTWDSGVLDLEAEYRLGLTFRYISGSTDFYARMLQGTLQIPVQREMLTPGEANTHSMTRVPPHLSHRGRFPQEPEAGEPVTLTIRVRSPDSEDPPTVSLSYFRGDAEPREETTLSMFDDGSHGDGFAADGTFGVALPGFPHNAQVHYIVTAEFADGVRQVSPLALEPASRLESEYWGYYVYDDPPGSVLPIYHFLIPGVNPVIPESVNFVLNCASLTRGSFAYRGELYPDVGIRFRGNTACFLKKRNLKLRFNRGREFLGLRKMNLEGLWTDKAMVRERLAWEFFNEIGVPYCETWYTRLHLNGVYHGLFLYLEHPDERFLARNDLGGNSCLYKARQPPRGNQIPVGVSRQSSVNRYGSFWEKETCEEKDLTELAEFIGALHDDAVPPGPTREFHEQRGFPEMLIGYQIGQVVLNNIDSFAKNHFLYQSAADRTRWSLITWDMDLVFGKFFDPGVVNPPERPVGTLNDCMLSDVRRDLNPWFTTTVNRNLLLHHFVDKIMLAGDGHFQRAYLVRLWDVLEEKYRVDTYGEQLDDLAEFLLEEELEDRARWGRYQSNPGCPVPPDMLSNIEIIKRQILLHRRFLVRYIETCPFLSHFSGENTWAGVEYHRPMWGVVMAVEAKNRNAAIVSEESDTNNPADTVNLHKFGYGV